MRLKEGDPERQTKYSTDPARVAECWLSAGAAWLHVINLDGAFEQPDAANRQALHIILETAKSHNAAVQFGGGLRDLEAVKEVLDLGVSRAILGTLAIKQPDLFKKALKNWGAERIAVSLDARDGIVQVRGWQEATTFSAIELGRSFQQVGLRWLIFTDISRDGLQMGLNISATVEMARATGLQVIASGGVRSYKDIENARNARLAGVIAGRALYEGAIDPVQLFSSTDSDTW